MSNIYGSQLEPFEEHQSPSPTETTDNPYETTLASRSSSSPRRRGSGPPSPVNTVNTLHRQLSGDPESPPPAWKRRPTVSTRQSRSPNQNSNINTNVENKPYSPVDVDSASISRSPRSPSETSVKSRHSINSNNRRYPPSNLTMTTTAAMRNPVGLPNGMFLHESPNGSSTSLHDGELVLPNPAFRRRNVNGNGSSSNRSSIALNQDLSSLTSEELWALGQDQDIPDMSNPMRQAAETPLDTVKRMSRMVDKSDQTYHGGLPGDVIWPMAPPVQEISPSIKSKSFTNVASLGMSNRRMSRRSKSRQSSIDMTSPKDIDGPYNNGGPMPNSPGVNGMGVLSSAHSSSTSLTSQALPPNKSFSSIGNRPPSTYYSRDFLSSLAPREGGYAIAAQMGGGLGAAGTMSVEEKRRSTIVDDGRSRTMGSRAPPSKSAGMGRWSLDGGENFGRPYATASAATTSSNLSAPPINSAEPSPTAEERTRYLPEGASPAYTAPSTSSGPSIPISTTPPSRSPLVQQAPTAEELPSRSAIPPPPPIPVSNIAPPPALTTKKSKKQLAKDAKAAEKAEAVKVARQRAETARAEALRKQSEREEAKRKEKEDKARLKAEKKAAKKGKGIFGLSSSSSTSATAAPPKTQPIQPKQTAPPVSQQISSRNPPAPTPIPIPQATTDATDSAQSITGTPFPQPAQSSQSAYKIPLRDTVETPRATHHSMPLNATAPANKPPTPSSSTRPPIEPKRSLFGTMKKRFSFVGGSDYKGAQSNSSAPPVPKLPPTPSSPVVSKERTDIVTSPASSNATALPPRGESLTASTSISQAIRPEDNGSISDPNVQSPSSPNFNLAKTISREQASSSPSRKRNSLHGPRPMPDNKSRPTSVMTHSSELAGHGQNQTQENFGPVTPSTSGDSGSYIQSYGSHMTSITPITSPEDDNSFNNNSTNEDFEQDPKRLGSGDSNKTIHAGTTNPVQPILA
ncbi:uncharacterized protein IL334_004603 [Kwoniella shivajii]|uniref:Glucoamylase n=1 Tax=Kwoniella shivajii TaxID=564305 RepID=A0ABZ1D0S7_9TREE|nr:hypothetical protein IL334_004603 [Kwoniella shivajii]